jgi:hypothetical protein
VASFRQATRYIHDFAQVNKQPRSGLLFRRLWVRVPPPELARAQVKRVKGAASRFDPTFSTPLHAAVRSWGRLTVQTTSLCDALGDSCRRRKESKEPNGIEFMAIP